jgi:hypothetical protein
MIITNKILFFEEFKLTPNNRKYYWLIDNRKRIEKSGLNIKIDRLLGEWEFKAI